MQEMTLEANPDTATTFNDVEQYLFLHVIWSQCSALILLTIPRVSISLLKLTWIGNEMRKMSSLELNKKSPG